MLSHVVCVIEPLITYLTSYEAVSWDEPETTPVGNNDVICDEPDTIPLKLFAVIFPSTFREPVTSIISSLVSPNLVEPDVYKTDDVTNVV